MRKICLMLIILMVAGSAMAGTLTSGTAAPTDVFASGSIDGPSWTKIFATGSPSRTDGNYGRGNEIIFDGGGYGGYWMDALVVRKDGNQDFTQVSGASLTLYIFEGTKEMWDLGDGQGDGDLFDETGITTIYTDTFALNGIYAEGDYITLTLSTPIFMLSEMSFFIQMTQGTTGDDFFQIVQRSNAGAPADGYQYQSKTSENSYWPSPLEYYATGVPGVSPTGDVVDPLATTVVTWDAPIAFTPEVGYDLIIRKPTEPTEPNFAALDNIIEITDASASSPYAVTLDYSTTYWCQVTAYEPNGIANDASDDIPHNIVWSFTTATVDAVPVVTLADNYITWPDVLPQLIEGAVDDYGEGDLEPVVWEIISGPGVATDNDAQMMDRIYNLGNISADPNLLFRDWIGTDCKQVINSDVLTLTLSGLPSGSYTWKSYHYDAQSDAGSAGVFDLIVTDSTGSTTTTDIIQSFGTEIPAVFTTTFTSNGSDVTLKFVGNNDDWGLFMLNGFELTGTGDTLYIDFGNDPEFVAAGYQGFFATNKQLDTFVPQSFAAFGTTVTLTPDWDDRGIDIISEGGTLLAPTATVDMTGAPKYIGTYTIQLTAKETIDDGQEPQVGSDTMQIKLAEDACAAAQLLSGFAYNVYDIDQNCVVDLQDFAVFAAQWLDDTSLDAPAVY